MKVRRGPILLTVILGSGIVFLDGTIVNVALETIGRDLPSTLFGRLEGLTYVSSGYLAVLAALLILAGALSDRVGRRRVFRLGLLGFGITSAICGAAPNMEVLILARLLQGAAGALLVPGALSIITARFEGEERGRAIGIWAASTSALVTLGPLLGGFLVQAVSWRAAFLVNLPLVLVAVVALRAVPESRNEGDTGGLDWLGAIVAAVAVGGLAFGATRGQEQAWQDPLAFVALGIGALALVAFPVLMAVRPHPLVPLGLFRSRNFSVVNLSTLVIYGALYVSLTFQNLFLQGTLGYTPLASGMIGIPSSLLLTILSTPAGRLAGRYGARPFMVAGPLLMATGIFWISRIPSTSTAWAATPSSAASLVPPFDFLVDVLPSTLLFGLGIALLVAPLTTALMASIPVARAGDHERPRAGAAGQAAGGRREDRQQQARRDPDHAGGQGRVAQRSLEEKVLEREADVERAVDHERGQVHHREVARPEEAQGHERVRPDGHQHRERHQRERPDPERDECHRVLPGSLLAARRARDR